MSEVPVLATVDESRKKLQLLGFWSEDREVGKLQFEQIPVIKGSRLGVRRGDTTFPITDRGGIMRCLGIHPDAMHEYEDDGDLIKRMIAVSQEKRATNVVRLSGDIGGVNTVQEASGSWMSPLEVFDIAVEVTEPIGVQFADYRYGHFMTRFVSRQGVDRPRKVGDIVHAGITVKQNGSVEVGPYCHRVFCSNGMARPYEKLATVGSRELVAPEIRSACEAANVSGLTLAGHLISLDNVQVVNREQVMVRLGHQFGLPDTFVSQVLQRLPSLGDDSTMFDVINIATELARDSKLQRERLMLDLGELTTELSKHCERCDHCGAILEN